jgi:hypothetical protein
VLKQHLFTKFFLLLGCFFPAFAQIILCVLLIRKCLMARYLVVLARSLSLSCPLLGTRLN